MPEEPYYLNNDVINQGKVRRQCSSQRACHRVNLMAGAIIYIRRDMTTHRPCLMCMQRDLRTFKKLLNLKITKCRTGGY
jgi:hypothetical protein